MDGETLAGALEREHREIDEGVEAFTSRASGHENAGHDDIVAALRRTMDALRRHIYLEEAFLFPAMPATLTIPMGVMLREHGEIWRTLDALDAQLAGGESPEHALETCAELVSRLNAHNAKEEPIFYPQADTVLTPSARAQLSGFMQTGEMPAGWVCQQAFDVSASWSARMA